jgi:purine-binding chemotaxis protein CheW
MAKKKRVVTQTRTRTVVTFHLGTEACAFPITDVYQILKETRVTRVPNVNRYVEGVFNLRGLVIPVVDLKLVLGLGVRKRSDLERLVIVEVKRRLVGFSVDAVGGVWSFEEKLLQSAPDVVLSKMIGRFVLGVVQRGQGLVVLLNPAEVVRVRRVERGGDSDAPATVARAQP